MKKLIVLMLALMSCLVGMRAESPEEMNESRRRLLHYYEEVDSTKIAVIYLDDVVREKVSECGYGTLGGSFKDYGYGINYLFIGVDKDRYEKVRDHLKQILEGYATITRVYLPDFYELNPKVRYFLRPYIYVGVWNEEEYSLVERACEDFGLTMHESKGYFVWAVKSYTTINRNSEEGFLPADYDLIIDPTRGMDPLEIAYALAGNIDFPYFLLDDGNNGAGLGNCTLDSGREVEIRAGVVQSPQQVRVTGVSGMSFAAHAGFDLNTLSPGLYVITAPGFNPAKYVVR